jgi:hypothetical protein
VNGMKTQIYYTKEHHIPAFQVIIPDKNKELLIDFLNPRTKVHEAIPLSELICDLHRMAFRQ